jgi:hypothetical protein
VQFLQNGRVIGDVVPSHDRKKRRRFRGTRPWNDSDENQHTQEPCERHNFTLSTHEPSRTAEYNRANWESKARNNDFFPRTTPDFHTIYALRQDFAQKKLVSSRVHTSLTLSPYVGGLIGG